MQIKYWVLVNKMEFKSLNLEEQLPPSPENIRMENVREYYSSEKKQRNRPDMRRMRQLIQSGYSGVARNIMEYWIENNPSDGAILELIVTTNDDSISPSRYIEWCRSLLDLNPENEIGLGGLVYHMGRADMNSPLDDEIGKLSSLYPDNAFGRKARLQRHMTKSEYNEALDECDALIQRDPKNKFALRQRPIILTKMGDFKSAAEYWTVWLDSGHASLDDKMASGRVYYNCKQYNKCISLMNEILDSYSNREAVLDLLVRSNYSLKNWAKCNSWCKELLSINSQSFEGQKYMRLTRTRIGSRLSISMEGQDEEPVEYVSYPGLKLWFNHF